MSPILNHQLVRSRLFAKTGAAMVLAICILGAGEAVLAQQQTPKNVNRQERPDQNRLRMAQDYERLGNYVGALRIFQNLFAEVPGNQLYYEGVKRNLIRLKRFEELLAIIQDQMAEKPDVKFLADMGDVHYKQGLPDQAEAAWNDALARFGQQQASYTYIANAMIMNRLYDQATEVYLKGRAHFNQPALFVFELANIYVIRLKYGEATREYLRHLESNPNQFSYIESRIINYTVEPEDARTVAEILENLLPESKQKYLVRKLLADLYLRIEAFAKAIEQFKMLETMEPPVALQ